MSKTKIAEQEAKRDGYVLTEKGERAARKVGKWSNSLADVMLQTMLTKSPTVRLTKGTLADDLWEECSQVLAKMEKEGLVEKVELEEDRPKVVIEGSTGLSNLGKSGFPGRPGLGLPKAEKLSRNVYSDRPGARLARKHHKGWKKVRY